MTDVPESKNRRGNPWLVAGAEAVMAEQCRARGRRAAVAAAAPTAALIGAEIVRAGGNAYDAAVASALAETVLLPPKCGLAGDLVALCWAADSSAPESLLAIGGAPAGLAEVAKQGGLQPTGPMSVGAPGAPAGYLALARRGRLPLERLAAPAIELARDGFCWSRICSSLAEESAALVARFNPSGTRYYPDGNVIEPGAVTVLPGLAAALESFVESPEDFLAGPVGDAIVRCVRDHGGVLTRQDLSRGDAEWVESIPGRLAGHALFSTPAPTHGPALVRSLAKVTARMSEAAVRVHADVMNAIAWRRQELADPLGTSMVSAVDDEGTLVVIVHSNSYPRFGSGLIVEAFDLILSNRAGRGFSADPGHPNHPVAGRRPATTLHAWAVRTADRGRLLGATPGGANQMPWNSQTLARLAAGETDLGRLIAAPRWEWRPDDALRVERGFSEAELELLRASAKELEFVDRWALHSAMQIVAIDDAGRVKSAAVDPRTAGAALAF